MSGFLPHRFAQESETRIHAELRLLSLKPFLHPPSSGESPQVRERAKPISPVLFFATPFAC